MKGRAIAGPLLTKATPRRCWLTGPSFLQKGREIALIFQEQRGQLTDPASFLLPLLCSLPPLGCIRTSATSQRWVERHPPKKQAVGHRAQKWAETSKSSSSIPPSFLTLVGRESGALRQWQEKEGWRPSRESKFADGVEKELGVDCG